MKQRSLLLFEESIKSKATRNNYLDHMQQFLKFTKLKGHDEMVSSMLTEQGMWLHDNGQSNQAKSFFAKAVEKNPANVQAKSMLK